MRELDKLLKEGGHTCAFITIPTQLCTSPPPCLTLTRARAPTPFPSTHISGKYQASATVAGDGVGCDTCPNGHFQNAEGAEACLKCEPGMLSNPTYTACE